MKNISLVIPTYRTAHVSKTVEAYSLNFAEYHHQVPIIIFDDCPYDVSMQYLPLIAGASHSGGLFYVGAPEKEQFLAELASRIGNEGLLRKMFRPSYGGNRNFTIAYTLGEHFISVDDDMRPHGLMSVNQSIPIDPEVARGIFIHYQNSGLYARVEFDIVAAFASVLGKKVGQLGDSYVTGQAIHDTLTDLLTNTTVGEIVEGRESALFVGNIGVANSDAVVKIAQTYRTGSSDVDAYDYAQQFLEDDGPRLLAINDMALKYVLKGFAPCVTSSNWRIDCGVSAYDNTSGLPPFLPTKLRCEDYGNRLWAQSANVATAHVAAVQTHYRDPYNRQSIPRDFHNEAHANYFKDVLRRTLDGSEGIVLKFHEDWVVDRATSRELVDTAKSFYLRAVIMSEKNTAFEREYIAFAREFLDAYDNFDVELFHSQMQERISREAALVRDSMNIWPAVVDAVFEMKCKGRLPMRML